MKINIPEIGDILQLNADWSFVLYPETRNIKLAKFFNLSLSTNAQVDYWATNTGVSATKVIHKSCNGIVFEYNKFECMILDYAEKNPKELFTTLNVTLGAGTELLVDRVYIRKGAKDFSSLSFFIKNGPYKGARFWAKLNEVNQMEVI